LNFSPPCPSQASRRWESNFLLLLQFRDREGHLRVPTYHVEDGHKLGSWICMNRAQQKSGTLYPERLRRLNEIGFIWNAQDARFDTMIRALTQFKQREGHCNVSQKHIEHLDGGVKLKLGSWVKSQRGRQVRGALSVANTEKLLERRLAVKWTNHKQEIDQALFDRNFDLLLVFKEREGHVRVPTQHQESANDHLGEWLKKQRSLHRNGLLELDQQKWLEVAGVTWESRSCS
jgi:hypothetical protein